MGDGGVQLSKFIEEVRTFSCQLAELVGTVENQLGTEKWSVYMQQNVCIPNPATGLRADARTWFPVRLFRFYHSEQHPTAIAFVSVLLGDAKGVDPISEPLLCGGWLSFLSATAAKKVSIDQSWWPHLHASISNRRDDGTLCTAVPGDVWPDEYQEHPEWYPFHRIASMALPLAEVTTAQILSERFVKPLLGALRQA
jgi:hypothetical protein